MGDIMYWIIYILQNHQSKSMSTQELKEKLSLYGYNVGIKAIRSCIQKINAFWFEWLQGDMIVSHQKSGLSINRDFFTDGELQFLLDSITFHQDLKKEDKDKLSKKLLSFSSYYQKQRLVMFSPIENELSFSLFVNITTIMKAIEKKVVICFEYVNYEIVENQFQEVLSHNGNRDTLYMISPYQIVNQNNHYYLISYNQKHSSQLTTYRVDRMRKIHTVSQSFIDIREQFNMSDEISKMTNMFVSSKRDTLQIECQQSILREIVSRFGMDISVKKLYNELYLVTIEDIAISDGLIGWIMMLQSQIRVIYPVYLKEEMQKRIHKMYELYNQS